LKIYQKSVNISINNYIILLKVKKRLKIILIESLLTSIEKLNCVPEQQARGLGWIESSFNRQGDWIGLDLHLTGRRIDY